MKQSEKKGVECELSNFTKRCRAPEKLNEHSEVRFSGKGDEGKNRQAKSKFCLLKKPYGDAEVSGPCCEAQLLAFRLQKLYHSFCLTPSAYG